MQVRFPMKIKDKYIHALQKKYCHYASDYGFSYKQFQFPIQRIIDSIEYVIQQYDKDSFELPYKYWRNFRNNRDQFDIDGVVFEAFKRVMYYSDQKLDVIEQDLQRCSISFPKHQQPYLDYISAMTNEVVDEVLRQTLSDSNHIGLRRGIIFTIE